MKKIEIHVFKTFFLVTRFVNRLSLVIGTVTNRTNSETTMPNGTIVKAVTERSFSGVVRGFSDLELIKFHYEPNSKDKNVSFTRRPKVLIIKEKVLKRRETKLDKLEMRFL